MRHKVGDKVKIKTWEQMRKEFGSNDFNIKCHRTFTDIMEIELNNLNINRLLTIKSIANNRTYHMEEMMGCWEWSDDMIKGLAKPEPRPGIFDPINNRWEILDL